MNATNTPSGTTTTTTNDDAPNNPYTDFQAGTTAALRSWSALREAVTQSWGGSHSASKAEELRTIIFTFFDGTSPNPKMDSFELEDNLLGYMEDEFGVVLEDGSERELADLIVRMYEACAKGDVSLARSVVRDALKAEEVLKGSGVKSVIRSGDDDMDEDDSDAEGGGDNAAMEGEDGGRQQQMSVVQAMTNNDGTTNNNIGDNLALAYASETLFGGPPKPKKELPPPRQLGVAEPEKAPPVVDDDGFAPVATKRKGKKR